MNRLLNKKIFLSLLLVLICAPSFASATTLYFNTKEKDFFVGDNIVVDVVVDSEGREINAIDGKIFLDFVSKNISVGDLSVAGSAFSLWPQRPSLSMNEKEISFIGGIPDGINSNNLVAFKIILNLDKQGKVVLKTSELNAYLNDGKGTKDVVSTNSFELNILPKPEGFESRNEWTPIIQKDHNPPKHFEIFLGQEGSVFDGKKFLSFNTTDHESGVAYYEVLEGDLPPVRSGNTYVLQKQDESVKLVVRAYDFAGNVTQSVYTPDSKNTSYLPILIFIIFIIILIFILKKMRKIKNEIVKN